MFNSANSALGLCKICIFFSPAFSKNKKKKPYDELFVRYIMIRILNHDVNHMKLLYSYFNVMKR